MHSTNRVLRGALTIVIAAAISSAPMAAQGKGKGGGSDDRGKGRGAGRAAEAKPQKSSANAERRETRADRRIERQIEHEFAGDVALPRRGRAWFRREVNEADLRPSVRRFFALDRAPARAAVGAVARAHMRGVDADEIVITPIDDRIRILNHAGLILVDLDERVRNLGRWNVIPVDGVVGQDAPAFCRSGEGHPVFGRQWCIDKRFGLGDSGDFGWARTDRITDLVFLQPVATGVVARDALESLLGRIPFDRLALHAITLGLSEPLTGRWIIPREPGAPRVLLVSSGKRPVAEVVDIDQDNRADMLVVALRRW
jgi:hypothetical protein